jgi:peptide/nickel transport system permease protein
MNVTQPLSPGAEVEHQPETEVMGEEEERYYLASQRQLIWWKFRKHKLAVLGVWVLGLLYLMAVFCEFLSPYTPTLRFKDYVQAPPQAIRIYDPEGGLQWPFVYGLTEGRDPETYRLTFVVDKQQKFPIRLFVHGEPYKFWGLFRTDVHLFGVEKGYMLLFGTDTLGMDVFSRTIYGSRISLSIGLVGVFFSFLLGVVIGGVSGYFGGLADSVIQRAIDLLISIPTIPLWLALAAALPRDWPVTKTYFMITVILSIIGWGSLARVVRGKLLSLRDEDFVMAAKFSGATELTLIVRHLLPSFASYIIVSITLSIPGMILGETALSFLGLGMQPPAVSWGVLLKEAQNIVAIAHHPWQLIPCLFVITTVLMFNFVGDGLRDAADPYR